MFFSLSVEIKVGLLISESGIVAPDIDGYMTSSLDWLGGAIFKLTRIYFSDPFGVYTSLSGTMTPFPVGSLMSPFW